MRSNLSKLNLSLFILVFLLPATIFGCADADRAVTHTAGFLGAPAIRAGSNFASSKSQSEFHGNWCGPNHPPPGSNPVPIDRLDELCRKHDQCYGERGFQDCKCDVELVQELHQWKDKPNDIKRKADVIATYFQNSECLGCKETVYGFSHWRHCSSARQLGCSIKMDRGKGKFDYCPNTPAVENICKIEGGTVVNLLDDKWAQLNRVEGQLNVVRLTDFGCLFFYFDDRNGRRQDEYCFDNKGSFPINEQFWVAGERPGKLCVEGLRFKGYD